jgi:hypothetical protein
MKNLFRFAGVLAALSVPGLVNAAPSETPHPQTTHVNPGDEKSIVDLAVEYLKPRKNGVAILIWDGHKDEIQGQEIAELFIKWFDEQYGLRVMCFVYAPEDISYSGVSYIVGDIPYGPWDLMEAKNNMDTIAAAYDTNILMRYEAEQKAKVH